MTPREQHPGREHSVTPMVEVDRRIANGWYDRKGCRHWEDRVDWRDVLCPACKVAT